MATPRTTKTLKERELLFEDYEPHHQAFHPRAANRQVTAHMPRNITNLDCSHYLRTTTNQAAHGYHQLQYRLWLEAGKQPLAHMENIETEYNSNMWRNFRKCFGFDLNSGEQRVGDMIASMYPINIPAPSQIGPYTYARFLAETPLIKDHAQKELAINRTKCELLAFEELALISQMKNPPMDSIGNILPPKDFRQYSPHSMVVRRPTSVVTPTRTDIFGKQVPLSKREPQLWKLTAKINNPQFQHMEEQYKSQLWTPRRPPLQPFMLTYRQYSPKGRYTE